MIFDAADALEARIRFKGRLGENIGLIAVCFVAGVFIASFMISRFTREFFPMFLADVAAVGIAWYFFVQLEKRPIKVRCPSCNRIILSNTPWVCGFCNSENRDGDDFSFLGKCSSNNCHAEPKAYKCHHCGTLIFFTEDRSERNYAYCINYPGEESEAEKRAKKVRKKREKKEDIEQKIEVRRSSVVRLELEEQLRQLKLRLERQKQAPLERKQKEMEEFMDLHTGIQQIGQAQKLKNAEKYKNDPKSRKKADFMVDQWVRSHMVDGMG